MEVVYLATVDAPVTRTTCLTTIFTGPARTAVTITGHVITAGCVLARTPIQTTHDVHSSS